MIDCSLAGALATARFSPRSLALALLLLLASPRAASSRGAFAHGWERGLDAQFIDFGYSQLSDAQAAFVATHYSVVSLEKCTGPFPTETGIATLARKLKAFNPSLRVLSYLHTDAVSLDCYAAFATFKANPRWWLVDDAGNVSYNAPGVPVIDVTVPEARDFWVGILLNESLSGGPLRGLIDGVLADGTGAFCGQQHLSAARCSARAAAKSLMIQQLQLRLNQSVAPLDGSAGGSVVGNGFFMYPQSPDPLNNLYTLGDMDGIMLEHFAVFESVTRAGALDASRAALSLARVSQAAALGKFVVLATWPGLCVTPFAPTGFPSWPGDAQPKTMQGWREALVANHTFAFAAYLTVAEVNVWMQYQVRSLSAKAPPRPPSQSPCPHP